MPAVFPNAQLRPSLQTSLFVAWLSRRVPRSPFDHLRYDREQRPPKSRSSIFYFWWNNVIRSSVNYPQFGQGFEFPAKHSRRNHLVTDGSHCQFFSEFTESEWSILKIPEDPHLVLSLNDLWRPVL